MACHVAVLVEYAEPKMAPAESIAYASELVYVFGKYCWRSTAVFALPFQSNACSEVAVKCPYPTCTFPWAARAHESVNPEGWRSFMLAGVPCHRSAWVTAIPTSVPQPTWLLDPNPVASALDTVDGVRSTALAAVPCQRTAW